MEHAMGFQPQYWHWIVFGLVQIIAELFVPSFTIFWFGLAALAVGVILLAAPTLSFTWQLFTWAVASCLMAFLWFKFFKPLMADRTKAGISREAILGATGQVIRAPGEDRRGVVRFATPLLGEDEWPFISEEPVSVGDRVAATDVSGNTLIVAKR
jgi:membrane protein implicated in regulation of membrane protease activity